MEYKLVARDLGAGSVAGIVTILVMTPFDTARTRLQVSKDVQQSGWQVLRRMRKDEGIRSLYKGMLAPLCAQVVYKMVMFSAFGISSRFLESKNLKPSSLPIGFACGAFAGFLNSFVVCPVELIRNKLAVQKGFSNLKYSGPLSVIQDVIKNNGVLGMFQGISATLLRDVPGVGAYFAVFHFVKGQLTDKTNQPISVIVPISGACAGISFWTIALPLDAVKTKLQTVSNNEIHDLSLKQAIKSISFRQIYRTGYSMALARGIPGSSITFSVQSRVSRWIDENVLLLK